MSFGSRHTSKVQQIIPDTRHDPQLLRDTVLSIKASFRTLEQSGSFLEQKVSKSRTRILGQLLSARHDPHDEFAIKPALPTMPWSTPRMDSRPLANVYAKAQAAMQVRRADSRSLKVPVQLEADSDADSDCSDSSSSISKLDLEARAAELAEPEPAAGSERRRSSASSTRSSYMAQDELQEDEDSPPPARSERGSVTSSNGVCKVVSMTKSQSRRPSTAGNAAPPVRRASFYRAREPWPRPKSKVQLRVQVNRPFSAPRMRFDSNADSDNRPATAPAAATPAMPATPRTPRTPRQKVGRPVSAAAARPARPKSAFTYARRPQSPRIERPPLVPHCQPQARWMAGQVTVETGRRKATIYGR